MRNCPVNVSAFLRQHARATFVDARFIAIQQDSDDAMFDCFHDNGTLSMPPQCSGCVLDWPRAAHQLH
jgi:hypothetical protein